MDIWFENIRILKFKDAYPPEIEYSYLIKSEFHVEEYRGHKKIAIRDLMVDFAGKATKFLQMDHIFDQLKVTRVETC